MKVDKLTQAIFTFSRLIKEGMAPNNYLTSLTMLQVQALVFLEKHPAAQMSEIAQYFKIEMPSATSLMNKLVTMKLVDRKADKKDRRKVLISITSKGTTLLNQAMEEKNKKMSEVLSYLSDNDRQDLLRIMEKLFAKINIHEK